MKSSPNQTTLVEWKFCKFLVFDAPSHATIDLYLKDMSAIGVTDVVRVCEPTYDKKILEEKGITVHDWAYPDGDAPPLTIIYQWLDLIKDRTKNYTVTCSIGVHCVAGLGRAPALVALALIDSGMAPLDSVIYVRERRRGAINAKQLKFLEAYKPKSKKEKTPCAVM